MRLHFLTNENKLLQEKMRFFSDYFSFVNEYIGLLPEIPLDNCLSLTGKVLFQLRNNLEKCPVYIENYFKQIQSFYISTDIKKTAIYLNVEKQFQGMKSFRQQSSPVEKRDNKVQWIKANTDFIKNIGNLEDEYQKDLDINFDALYTYIHCSHSLNEHKEKIKYCTHNLVSELRLNGATKSSLDTYIDRILSDEQFPLPIEILQNKNKETQKEEIAKFISGRNFKDQFYGFKNVIAAPLVQTDYFIYRIENCRLEKSIEKSFYIEMDRVVFISPFHEKLRIVRINVKQNDKRRIIEESIPNYFQAYPRFFNKKNILAYVQLNYESRHAAMKEGLSIVKRELSHLNGYMDTNLNPNTNDYMFTETLGCGLVGHSISLMRNTQPTITKHNFSVASSTPFEILRNIKSDGKLHLLSLENTFFQAVHNTNPALYWVYIENLFWNTKYSKAEDARKVIVRILLNRGLPDLKINFLHSIVDLLNAQLFTPAELGINFEERKYIFNEVYIQRNSDFNIAEYKKKITIPLFKEIVDYHTKFLMDSQKEKWRSYFSSILLELYEYRNADLHSGKTNKHHLEKLETAIPRLVNHLRRILVDDCKANPDLSFEELVDFLSKEA